ncbi:MAG: kynureninase [Pseudomonadota bacterium]
MTTLLETARARDLDDPLAPLREQFTWPRQADGTPQIYLCGNSLGLQPRRAADRVREVLHDWASLGVAGHFDAERSWMPYHHAAAPLLAELISCHADEVVAMNSLTVNLNLLLVSFYRPTNERWKILIEADAFPSDRYAVQSQVALHGRDPDAGVVLWHAGDDGLSLDTLEALLDEHPDIALAVLPGVQYLTGEVLNIAQIAKLMKQFNVTFGVDLAHAIGNVPVQLHDNEIDFAVFCTYKYLNAGPGAVGGAYIHRKHHGSQTPKLLGWWGNAEKTRFQMAHTFDPAQGADVWQHSNPPILALAPVIASLELFSEVGLDALRRKSMALTGWLREVLEQTLSDDIVIATPNAIDRQGCQLSLHVRGADGRGKRVFDALHAGGVVCDWREPNIIRVAPAPLYNNFADVAVFVEILQQALRS